jgi:hypothetical protein
MRKRTGEKKRQSFRYEESLELIRREALGGRYSVVYTNRMQCQGEETAYAQANAYESLVFGCLLRTRRVDVPLKDPQHRTRYCHPNRFKNIQASQE